MWLKITEAIDLYCPFGFVSPSSMDIQKCVANECMMWRWDQVRPYIVRVDGKGYCGLAGKPKKRGEGEDE